MQRKHSLQPPMPKMQHNTQIRTDKDPKHVPGIPTHHTESENTENKRRTKIPTQKERYNKPRTIQMPPASSTRMGEQLDLHPRMHHTQNKQTHREKIQNHGRQNKTTKTKQHTQPEDRPQLLPKGN